MNKVIKQLIEEYGFDEIEAQILFGELFDEKMKKYRFTFFTNSLDKYNIRELNRVKPDEFILYQSEQRALLSSYTFDYEIPKRTIIGSFKSRVNYRHSIFGTGCGPTIHKEVKVDWRETIYNMKVQKVRKSKFFNYKISFSVKVTPKEAYLIGKELEKKYYQASYKCKE